MVDPPPTARDTVRDALSINSVHDRSVVSVQPGELLECSHGPRVMLTNRDGCGTDWIDQTVSSSRLSLCRYSSPAILVYHHHDQS